MTTRAGLDLQPTRYGIWLRVFCSGDEPGFRTVIERAPETSPGSGSPDTASAAEITTLPIGLAVADYIDELPSDGARYFYRAFHRRSGWTDSAKTGWVDAKAAALSGTSNPLVDFAGAQLNKDLDQIADTGTYRKTTVPEADQIVGGQSQNLLAADAGQEHVVAGASGSYIYGPSTGGGTNAATLAEYGLQPDAVFSLSGDVVVDSDVATNPLARVWLQFYDSAGTAISSFEGNSFGVGESGRSKVENVTVPATAAHVVIEGRCIFSNHATAHFTNFMLNIGPKALPYVDPVARPGNRADQRYVGMLTGGGTRCLQDNWTGDLITSTDLITGCRIDVVAHDLVCGFGTIHYNATSGTGFTNNTLYYVYFDDPAFDGGTKTLNATTNPADLPATMGRYWVGAITTTADGGGDTTGSSGGAGCVSEDALVPTADGMKRAADVEEGDVLDTIADRVDGGLDGGSAPVVRALVPHLSVCVRVESESGAVLVVAAETMVRCRDGRSLPVGAAHGQELPVGGDGGLRWERVRVAFIGMQKVRCLNLMGATFAAGMERGRYIYTHNTTQPPPIK